MKVLTIKQPWAHMIIHGDKRIENRSWKTRYRGPILIHAGKGLDNRGFKMLGELTDSYRERALEEKMHFGAIIGIVDLVNCVELKVVKDQKYAEGPFCWMLKNPRGFEPIQDIKGKLGLWNFDESLLKENI